MFDIIISLIFFILSVVVEVYLNRGTNRKSDWLYCFSESIKAMNCSATIKYNIEHAFYFHKYNNIFYEYNFDSDSVKYIKYLPSTYRELNNSISNITTRLDIIGLRDTKIAMKVSNIYRIQYEINLCFINKLIRTLDNSIKIPTYNDNYIKLVSIKVMDNIKYGYTDKNINPAKINISDNEQTMTVKQAVDLLNTKVNELYKIFKTLYNNEYLNMFIGIIH